MSKGEGRLIVISGPSGTGKGTVIAMMLEKRPGMEMSVSATTRKPRAGEIDGVSYHFISVDKFNDMIGRGEFLEYAEYAGDFYGTPKKAVFDRVDNGIDVLLEIEVKGARQVTSAAPGAISIFLTPPDLDELERRLRGRGTDSEDKLKARLEIAKAEIAQKGEYKHVVVNDKVERAAEEILEIIDGTII